MEVRKVKVFIDESYFTNQKKLDDHYDKHVASDDDCDLQMDEMTEEVYNELSNRLSLAHAEKYKDRNAQIVGYFAENHNIVKFDKESGLCVVYDPVRDSTNSLYKTFLKKFIGKADAKNTSDKRFAYKSDIPEQFDTDGTFNYEHFMKEFEIEHRKEFSINPNRIQETGFFVPEDKFNTLLNVYSENTLDTIPNIHFISLYDIDSDNKKDFKVKERIKAQVNLFGEKIKFKVCGYFNNGEIEAVQIKLSSLPECIGEVVDINEMFTLVLSTNGTNTTIDIPENQFEPVTQQIKSYGVFGGMYNQKPIYSKKYMMECIRRRLSKMLRENKEVSEVTSVSSVGQHKRGNGGSAPLNKKQYLKWMGIDDNNPENERFVEADEVDADSIDEDDIDIDTDEATDTITVDNNAQNDNNNDEEQLNKAELQKVRDDDVKKQTDTTTNNTVTDTADGSILNDIVTEKNFVSRLFKANNLKPSNIKKEGTDEYYLMQALKRGMHKNIYEAYVRESSDKELVKCWNKYLKK